MSENSGMTDALAALDSLDDFARMAGVEAIGPLGVLRGVIADRDRLTAEVLRLQAALRELHAMVSGECPSLLNEDSGGNAMLDLEIEELLSPATSTGETK